MAQTELNEEPEEFEQAMYHISHDVRAPLRAVRQIADWLREDIGCDRPVKPLAHSGTFAQPFQRHSHIDSGAFVQI